MKYCKKCNVNVHRQLDTCPLCGSYLDPKNGNDNCAVYAEMDKAVEYPILHEKERASFFKYKFNQILFAFLLISVALNIILTPNYHWSAYVAIGFVFVVLCITMPLNNKFKIAKQIRVDVFALTVIAVALEFAIGFGKFSWISVEFVLPWIYVAAIVLNDFLIIFQRSQNRQLYSTLLYSTVYAIIPQILLWIAKPLGWYEPKTVINFVIFFAVLLNLTIVYIVSSKSLKEEMERNLNV